MTAQEAKAAHGRLFQLEGRNALVTGAGRGLGAAMAEALARAGAHVIVNDIDAGFAEMERARLSEAGLSAEAIAFDVAMGHHEEPQVAAHLLAAVPNGTFVECFDPDRDPIWWNLVANRAPLADGKLALPTEPGLGWELDLDFIERYRLARP